ncbi:MAG: hypothetical protein K2K16_03915 [Ruminococcus sp.]|nr:hypothetical protein [Ruminococcus sp.]
MDMIDKRQHIKYLSDAIEYFRQKHGEDIKIYSVTIKEVNNCLTWYKIFRKIFSLKKYHIHFLGWSYHVNLNGNPEEDRRILEKAYEIIDGNFRKWNERSEIKNRK